MTVTSHDANDWVYPDNGCPAVSDSCFTCPLPICRYDVPGGLPVLLRAIRRREELLARARTQQGTSVYAAQIIAEEATLGCCTEADVRGPSRRQEHVEARDRAARRMRDSGMILKTIGLALGGRDHSTVIHSLRKTAQRTNGVTA